MFQQILLTCTSNKYMKATKENMHVEIKALVITKPRLLN